MKASELISGRRSIRRFSDRDISDEVLAQVLESVRWAPSWGNSQCWEIVVVRDQVTKDLLADTISARNPALLALKNAPVVLAVCGKLETAGYYKGTARTDLGDWLLFDLGLATQNLLLAAHALDLGTVIIGALDHARARDILKVPAGFELAVLVPMGYPDQEPSPPKRREQTDYVHDGTFTAKQ